MSSVRIDPNTYIGVDNEKLVVVCGWASEFNVYRNDNKFEYFGYLRMSKITLSTQVNNWTNMCNSPVDVINEAYYLVRNIVISSIDDIESGW